jgi:S-adenosylmethionine:tRNA ribosyltransferase-isomerase
MRYSLSDFDYPLPTHLIAQRPLPDRSASRLLVLPRQSGQIEHRRFRDFPALIEPGDVLVVNASRVMPARLMGRRDNGRPAEVLLVHPEPDGSWLAMVHPGGKLKPGRTVRFDGDAAATVEAALGGGLRRVRFSGGVNVHALMERHGAVPLPPYIKRPPDAEDRERYQTIFAKVRGSVAAPTAGLHFTPEIVQAITGRGGVIAEIVLHVGPGTFKPVETEDLSQHVMHAEWYDLPEQTATAVNRARESGARVWAIGTTAMRVLETAAATTGPDAQVSKGSKGSKGRESRSEAPSAVVPGSGWTSLFIHPPYGFRIVDALLTNFHLPRSTLLMLVCAFGGYERTMTAYREAVAREYRLYSYGDAMAVC